MSSLFRSIHKITNPPRGVAGAYISVAAAGDVFRYSAPAPFQVLRWGFIATTTVSDATNGLKLTGDVRTTAGSDVGRTTGSSATVASASGYNASGSPAFITDTAGGSLTVTAAATQVAAGKGVYHDMNPQAVISPENLYPRPDTAFVPPGGVDTQLVIYPGQEFLIAVQPVAPNAGAGILFIEVLDMPNVGLGYAGLAALGPTSIAPTPSQGSVNLTRVQS